MNWMTVKELAEYLKLSEMMVYKLAQNEEIPAAKIGSNWRFAQVEIDKWLLGKSKPDYEIPEPAKTVIDDIVADLKNAFKDDLATVIVFGSFARGDANQDSDLDLLVVLKSIPNQNKAKKLITDIAYNNTYEKNRTLIVAPILIDEKEFLTGSSPLLINVRKEGRRAA